ncbi:MAG: hypothetical protein JF570_03615 [Caulobacter sp.]|nr:hypothetical protein [Caulobacter sp.]MBW8891060.1 hypothetical protein [Burkholderiales bacterium]
MDDVMLRILMSAFGTFGMLGLALSFSLMRFTADIHPDPSRGLVYGVEAHGTTFYFSKINGLIYNYSLFAGLAFIVAFMLCGVFQVIADRKPDPRDI